jgi:hypothetical protein
MVALRPFPPFHSPSTTTVGAVVVRDEHGTRIAEARRRGDGPRARWRWSANDELLGTFVVEPTGDTGRGWLVTRTDGAPFGELTVRGRFRRRLEITDGNDAHLVVHPSGSVRDHHQRMVARLRDLGDDRVQLELCRDDLDPVWRSLLLAATLVRPGN